MAIAKRVVTLIMGLVLMLCMSGYVRLIPKVLKNLGLTKEIHAATDVGNAATNQEIKATGIIDIIYTTQKRIEAESNDVGFKNQFIEINGGFQRLLNKNFVLDADVSNHVYKMENGYLASITMDSQTIDIQADYLIQLNEYLQAKDIDLLYVQAPHKISKFDNQLPPNGVEGDYTNQNADTFSTLISDAGVDQIDLRQVMYDEGINQYDIFFKTDHHWLPEAGLWASSKIADYLNLNYGYDIPKSIYDVENYNVEVYDDIFLGSRGRRVGRLYAGLDDISLITPKFETDLEFSIPSKDIYREGIFREVIFDYDKLQYDYYNANPYAAYTGGNFPLNIIYNKNGNGKKALLIRDSFAGVTAPYLSLAFSELDIFDIRHNSDYTVYEYIEKFEPDTVIFLYHSGVHTSEAMFEFDKISEQAAREKQNQ